MDDKVFMLMEKMYIEMQEMKTNMATKQDLENMATKQDLESMATKQDLESMATKQDLVVLENEIKNNIKALYDGYQQSVEGISDIKRKVDKLTDKVDNQEIKLQVLKSVK